MSLKYSEISEAISLQPLHLIDEISHRVVSEYTEAICALAKLARLARPSGEGDCQPKPLIRPLVDECAGELDKAHVRF